MSTHTAKLASLAFSAKDWKVPADIGPHPLLKEWLQNPCAEIIKDDPWAETFVNVKAFAKWYGADLAKGKDITTFTYHDHVTNEMVVETKTQKISASDLWLMKKASFEHIEKMALSQLLFVTPGKAGNSGPLTFVKEEFVAWLQSLPPDFDFKRDTLNWLEEHHIPMHSGEISLSAWCPFAVYARHKLNILVGFGAHTYSTDGGRTQYNVPTWVSRFIYRFDKVAGTATPNDCLDICKTI